MQGVGASILRSWLKKCDPYMRDRCSSVTSDKVKSPKQARELNSIGWHGASGSGELIRLVGVYRQVA